MLGALEGFDDSERVAVSDMPELERYVLHRLGMIDTELRQAAEAYEFNRYTRLLTDFANEDLSAFFFDIRKDSLYCDAPSDIKRRSYRTVLDVLFHALVRYAAPVLCFTAEEVWQSRFPNDEGSVHYLEWPSLPVIEGYTLGSTWEDVRTLRRSITEAIEPLRAKKIIRSSLEANVTFPTYIGGSLESSLTRMDLAELAIVAKVNLVQAEDPEGTSDKIIIERTDFHKCGRCWRHLPEVTVDGELCNRCDEVVADA